MRKTKTISVFLLLFFLLGFEPVVAVSQSVLDAYIEEGIANNLQIKKEGFELNRGQLMVESVQAKRLPSIHFTSSYLLAQGGRSIELPVGDLLNPAYATLNQLTAENTFPTDLENTKEYLIPNNFNDTRFKISYPLYNRALFYNYKAQKEKISIQQAKMETFKLNLEKEIKMTYYAYFRANEVSKIYNQTKVLLKEVHRFNEKMIKAQKATAYLNTSIDFELEKIEGLLINVRQEQRTVQAYFNTLLNRNLEAIIEEDPFVKAIIEKNFVDTTELALNSLLDKALEQRTELKEVLSTIEVSQTTTKLNKKKRLPTVGLEGNLGFQGFGYHFNREQAFATIGIGLNWPIYTGKQHKLDIEISENEEAKWETSFQQLKQQIELEVYNTFYLLLTAKQKIRTAQAAYKSAKRGFDLIKKQYENQKALLIELLDAQTKLTNSQISISLAQFDFLIQKAALDRAVNQ